MKKFLKAHHTQIGMTLILVGVILLVVSYVAGLTIYRPVLLTAVAAIITGTILHVRSVKRQSKY